jgi:hypothetical protein
MLLPTVNWTAMPIRPFLNGENFDQETLRTLGVAFEQFCIGLPTEWPMTGVVL